MGFPSKNFWDPFDIFPKSHQWVYKTEFWKVFGRMARVRDEAGGHMAGKPTYEGRHYVNGLIRIVVLVELDFHTGKNFFEDYTYLFLTCREKVGLKGFQEYQYGEPKIVRLPGAPACL